MTTRFRLCARKSAVAQTVLLSGLLACSPLVPCAVSQAAPKAPNTDIRYALVDITTLPGASDDVAPDINDAVQISCWNSDAQDTIHATVWEHGQLQQLGALGSDGSSITRAINSHGDVVGWSVSGKNLVDSQSSTRAFLSHNGKLISLETLGGRDSQAIDLNDSDQVVGVSNVSRVSKHAFLYAHGKMADLGVLPGGSYSAANAINNQGVIVGTSDNAKMMEHAVIWSHGAIKDLGTLPGGLRSRARDINSHGDIVGFSEVEHGEVHAFLYQDGKMQDLGDLGQDPTRANGLNDQGQIVGSSAVTEYIHDAFVWRRGKMEDLNKLIPNGTGWHLQEAFAINNHGMILCTGSRPDGVTHLLLLTPIQNSH